MAGFAGGIAVVSLGKLALSAFLVDGCGPNAEVNYKTQGASFKYSQALKCSLPLDLQHVWVCLVC